MRKLLVLLLIVFLGGCMKVRTYTVEKPRKDTDIEGNRGYLAGEPEETKKESKLGPNRKISVVEFEFGPKAEKEKVGTEETETFSQPEIYEQEITEEEFSVSEIEGGQEKEYKIPSPEYEYKEYTIEKNDTLQKISRKFYGTTKKWKLIYQENKNILKSPDKIYSGTTIKVPILK